MFAVEALLDRLSGRVRWPKLAASAFAIAVAAAASRAHALDLDLKGIDGLNTETVAERERLKVWDRAEVYGANTVSNMDRHEFTPDGIRMGNYMVIPTIGAAVIFDDNIFAIDSEKVSDVRTELSSGIQFKSQLPRHVLDFSLDGKIVSYAENTDQDYANYRAKVDSALHFDSAHTLSASVSSLLKHEERDDPLMTLTTKEPVPILEHRASIGITRDVGRLYGTLAAGAQRVDYTNVYSISGVLLDQDSRDTDTFSAQTKIGYRFSPGFEFVTKMRALRSENRGNALGNFSSWGYEAVAGLAFETNPLLRWRILGGYGVRDYDNAKLDDIATSLLEADFQWLPTQRLTIYGTLSRQIDEAIDLNGSGVVQSIAKLRAEYEIFHNLVLSGALEYRNDDVIGMTRVDNHYIARAGLDYYFSKNWLFTFGYEHQVRDSTDDSLDLHRNRFRIDARLRF